MDDAGARQAAEAAWEAAGEVLDEDELDAAALPVLEEAARALAAFSDDQSRERRAQVLEGVVLCHARAGEGPALAGVVDEVLAGTWPGGALWFRLSAARVAVGSGLLPRDAARDLAARAVGVGEASDDDDCRALVAELLKLQAGEWSRSDLAESRALLTRVLDEFDDVDDPFDSAEDRLDDPYFRGHELFEQPGQVAAAEGAFRQAVEEGYAPAGLELAVVLGWQAGREDEEERALSTALEAETDPDRMAMAGYLLGCLLHYGRGDRAAAREAFGRATTGSGEHATAAVKELVIIAVLDGDHEARRQLVAELAGRKLAEFDEDARAKDHRAVIAASRLGYARPFIAVRAWHWRRRRRRKQRERAPS